MIHLDDAEDTLLSEWAQTLVGQTNPSRLPAVAVEALADGLDTPAWWN
jgi:hypothetical protein